jgi:uncharacterized protein (TIGR02246 family)
MRTATIVGITLLSAATMAAQASGQAQGGAQASGRAGAQAGGSGSAAIRQVADEYVKATLAADPKAVAALYTEDAVELPPNQPMIKGRAAIQEYYEKIFSSGMKMSTFTLMHLESRASGDSAYDVGTYEQSMTPAGGTAPASQSGKYVVILKRAGGAWKVAYAIYNSDQPPPTGGR